MMVAYGDRRRVRSEVEALFKEIHPNRQIFTSTVSKILRKFNETGNVRNRQKTGRPKNIGNDENPFNTMLDVTTNSKTSVQQLAKNHHMNRGSVQKILKRVKYHPHKFICYN